VSIAPDCIRDKEKRMNPLKQQPHSLSTVKRALVLLGACAGLALSAPVFAADPPGGHATNDGAAKAVQADGSVRMGDGSVRPGDGSVRTLVPAVQTGPQGGQAAQGGSDSALIGLLRPAGPEGSKQGKKIDASKQKAGQQ